MEVGVESTYFIGDYNYNGLDFMSIRLNRCALCGIAQSTVEYNSTNADRYRNRSKEAFCWEVPATLGIVGSCYSYDQHTIISLNCLGKGQGTIYGVKLPLSMFHLRF